MEPVLVVMTIFGTIGFIIWKFLDFRHKERMTLIEKGPINLGKDVKDLGEFFKTRPLFKLDPLTNLKWGMLFFSIGLAIFISLRPEIEHAMREEFLFSMVFIFGGVSLILFYFIAARKAKKEKDIS